MKFNKMSGLVIVILLFGWSGCANEPKVILKEPVLGMEFIKVRKGSFFMGDHKNVKESERLHKVTISHDYWLGKTEVTQKQWQKIMGNKALHPQKPSPFLNINPEFPKVSISYFDIEVFISRLNALSAAYHFRLPTEAEWEYACRAGTETPFSYGACLDDHLANYNAMIPSEYSKPGTYRGSPEPVASHPPNQWGFYDMHGNVWEWVTDWYAPYTGEVVINPTGPAEGTEKVIRGGSWYFAADNAKSSCRRTYKPNLWGFSIGFRLVCEKKK